MFPKTRAECVDGPRPCPYTKCRYYMEGRSSCALDVADKGPISLEDIAAESGYSFRQVRQDYHSAIRKLLKVL